VAVEQERRAAVLTVQPRDEIGTLGVAGVELALDPGRGEERLDVLDARPLVARWVRGVEADQLSKELDWIGYG
jgi:hypothetical protein